MNLFLNTEQNWSKTEDFINLLIITDSHLNNVGGSETFLRNLIYHLSDKNYQLTVIQLADELDNAQPFDRSIQDIAKLVHLPLGKIYNWTALNVIKQIFSIAIRSHIHLVLSIHEKADIIAAILPKRIKKVSTRRDMLICPSKALLRIRKILSSRFDVITAPCEAILKKVTKFENVSKDRWKIVIYNGIDLRKYNPAVEPAPDIIQLKEEGGIAGVCVANPSKVKGHVYLIEAFRQVVRKFPKAKLFMVGNDLGMFKDLIEIIREKELQNNIHPLGSRHDIPHVLTACDFIVSSSVSEGLSNALIEGLSSGLPCIGTNVGGTPEIIHHGINGFLVPPRDPDALAASIIRFCKSRELRQQMGLKSREIAEKYFDVRKNMAQYDLLFRQLLHTN